MDTNDIDAVLAPRESLNSGDLRAALELGASIANHYNDDTCDHRVPVAGKGFFLPIVGHCANLYGADANTHHLVVTNGAVIDELISDLQGEHDHDVSDYVRQYDTIMVITPEGELFEPGLALLADIAERFETYPLLDEDAYGAACYEDASKSMDSAIEDAVRDFDENLTDALDARGMDAASIINAALESGDVEWWEEECWPAFQTDLEGLCREALAERKQEEKRGAVLAATCPATLDMFHTN